MKSAPVGVVTKSDSAFFPGVIALLRSLQSTNPDIPIVVFDAGMTEPQAARLEAMGAAVLPLRNRFVPRAETVLGTHYNASIFALMEFSCIPFETIVHLDADIVVLGSLAPLATLPGGCDFAGVYDFPALSLADNIGDKSQQVLACDLLAISREQMFAPAFNAGIFAISKVAYERILPVMTRIYDTPLLLPRRDQTLLNAAIAMAGLRVAEPLPVHYNFRHRFRRAEHVRWDVVERHGDMLVPRFEGELVKIVHFIGPDKPWHGSFAEYPEALSVWSQFYGVGA